MLAQLRDEFRDFFVFVFGDLRLDFFLRLEVILIIRRIAQRLQQRKFRRFFTAGKDAMERVVIFRWNRIKFVIVTSRASHCQAECAARNQVNPVIDDVVLVVEKPAAQGQKTERGQGVPVI